MTEQITVPRATWDAVVEALERARVWRSIKLHKELFVPEVIEPALTAANAVSEAQPAGPEDMAIYKSIADGYLTKVQPVDEWTIRGTLAAKLKCWHRLKEDEASELVRLFAANAVSHPKPETTPSPEGGAITSESAANAVSHPQATEPAGWKLTDEHLQAAIYCREAGHVSVSLVQRKLRTSYNFAQEVCQHIINAGLVPGLTIAPSLTTAAAPEAHHE